MRTLIIPCAGKHRINGKPLFLARHPQDGQPILRKAIEGVFASSYDRILVVLLASDVKKYHLNLMVSDELKQGLPLEMVVLEHDTDGPADTVFEALRKANVSGEFAVKDVHTFVKLSAPATGNMIAGLDLTTYAGTIENLRAKSFIVTNEQGQVLDVIEKRFRSDIISVGFYGFRRAEDFVLAYQHLKNPDYPISKLYLSHVISYLIGYKNRIFQCQMAQQFEDWSTTKAWEDVSKRYATYILDLDRLFPEKRGTSGSVHRKLVRLARLGSLGARFICLTQEESFAHFATVIDKESPLTPYIIGKTVNCSASQYHLLVTQWNQFNAMLTSE